MALPLKSGADLYNNQALRMRLHNLGADPTEVGAGLIYFNTSTGLNTSQKVRLYTGNTWKTIVFSEDLDVASNADLLALKDRVDLLSGDVDTDNLINNIKDLEEFLKDFDETDKLKSLLDGKLDKTGGQITGDLYIQTDKIDGLSVYRTNAKYAMVHFYTNVDNKRVDVGYLGVIGNEQPIYLTGGGQERPLLHSGNYSNYALPLSGGTIEGTTSIPLYIKSGHTTEAAIGFSANNTKGYGYLIYKGGDVWNVTKEQWAAEYTLLHSGNVGKYKAGDSDKLGGQTLSWIQDNGRKFSRVKTATTSNTADANADLVGGGMIYCYSGFGKDFITNAPSDMMYGHVWEIGSNGNDVLNGQFAWDINHGSSTDTTRKLWWRARETNGWTNSKWHQIAFTDSNVASASKLETPRTIWGQRFDGTGDVSGNLNLGTGVIISSKSGTDRLLIDFGSKGDPYFGYGTAEAGISSNICGNNIYLRYGTSHTNGLILNSSGNVLIGTTTDNGAKLNVGGRIEATGSITAKDRFEVYGSQPYIDFHYGNSTEDYTTRLIEQTKGTLKLVGNLHVTGNIIADGEVSAGGRAEEGGNAGGGGAFHSESIAVGATQTTIAHGLGTDDIVVSIYEKDGVSGRWSIILTDVEIVDANNIIVSFGSATSVEHKVVIMGAVA